MYTCMETSPSRTPSNFRNPLSPSCEGELLPTLVALWKAGPYSQFCTVEVSRERKRNKTIGFRVLGLRF